MLIRGGTVVDGTGAPARRANVAIKDGLIAALGLDIGGDALEVFDADGLIVTPGFVDIHTHFDGQATWDTAMLPSAAHGVTTVVMGSCGIGFAPVRPGDEAWLVTLTEGVEDIPGSVLSEGIPWSWETFADYLDVLEEREYALDIATQVPHSALRAYVMGRRTADNAPATEQDIETMASMVRTSIEAGALGFATSRLTTQHFGSDGGPLPGTSASEAELMAMARAVRDAGGGVIQLAPCGASGDDGTVGNMGAAASKVTLVDEIEMMRRIHRETGLPVTFGIAESAGERGRRGFAAAMAKLAEVFEAGEKVSPQFTSRAIGALNTLDGYHAFCQRPSYLALAHLPLEARVARLADPAVKAAILAEDDVTPEKRLLMNNFPSVVRRNLQVLFPVGDRFDFEPVASQSILARAQAAGRDPLDYLYDYLLDDGGRSLASLFANNYDSGDLRVLEAMLRDPRMLLGQADAGAHVMAIADASQPTHVLAHWGKGRSRGPVIPLETLVRKQTLDPAAFYGLNDRGVIAPGYRADLNVIDLERLGYRRPRLVDDLPGGGRRFLQDAEGYVRTIVGGVVTRRDDRDTGARPGRLVRGRRDALIEKCRD